MADIGDAPAEREFGSKRVRETGESLNLFEAVADELLK